jgi:hypothetical protein
MNSENIESSKEKEINSNNTIIPNLQYKSNSFKSLKKDLIINNNINNSNDTNYTQTNPNSKKTKMNLSLENNDSESEHPLVFYALGKVKNKSINNNIGLFTSQGFRSSSNDMIYRNMFSMNSSNFDDIKKNKEYSTIKKQILEENDYLNPIKIYKSFHKYDVHNNCINQETFNLAKKKYYSRDRISNIKTGLYLTKSQFNEQKKNLLQNNTKYKTIKTDINTNNTSSNNNKSDLSNTYYFKDPNDYSKEELKSKQWRFDRNYKIFIKHKNWWNKDKYVIYLLYNNFTYIISFFNI